jgi:hypothetical protein
LETLKQRRFPQVGKISGPDSFAPEHAIILQNKDELMLPLLLEQLPTPQVPKMPPFCTTLY